MKKYLLSLVILLFACLCYANPITEIGPIAFAFGASTTSQAYGYNTNPGQGTTVDMMVLVMPNFTNAPTATLNIISADGYTVYSVASLANNATSVVTPYRPIVGANTQFQVVLSGVPGGSGGTVYLAVYLEQ